MNVYISCGALEIRDLIPLRIWMVVTGKGVFYVWQGRVRCSGVLAGFWCGYKSVWNVTVLSKL